MWDRDPDEHNSYRHGAEEFVWRNGDKAVSVLFVKYICELMLETYDLITDDWGALGSDIFDGSLESVRIQSWEWLMNGGPKPSRTIGQKYV